VSQVTPDALIHAGPRAIRGDGRGSAGYALNLRRVSAGCPLPTCPQGHVPGEVGADGIQDGVAAGILGRRGGCGPASAS